MIVLAAMPIFYIVRDQQMDFRKACQLSPRVSRPLILIKVLFFFLLPKSSRFLFSAGKNEEAKKSLRKISKKFPDKNIDETFLRFE